MLTLKGLRNGGHDTTQHMFNNYLREFSVQYRKYMKNKSDENLALVHRTISLLGTHSPSHFITSQLETAHFFVDLYGLMKTLSDSDVLWTCVSVLQNCTKNPEARILLMENYRFPPLLTHLLTKIQVLSDKATRLLTLLQELTYGIKINWEEPYIGVLLNILIQTIYKAAEESEETQATLALSILTNVCFKNPRVNILFKRTVKCVSEFSRKIQHYPLATKFLIILSEDLCTPEIKELHLFLRSTFVLMQKSVNDCNVAHLQHMVDLLLDAESHCSLFNAMLTYTNYCEDFERLLGPLENNANMSDTAEEFTNQRQKCLALIFKLILYVLKLSNIKQEDDVENVISLSAIIPRIFDLLCHWLESNICGTAAVQLFDGLINLVKADSIVQLVARDPAIVTQLIATTEKTDTTLEHTNAILQLLISLLQQHKTEKIILSKISESYFDKTLASLLAPSLASETLSEQENDKVIFCLLLLVNFANIAKKAYFEKCCKTLEIPQIQKAIARGSLCGNEAIHVAVFKIAQFEHFPRAAVSKQIAALHSLPTTGVKLKTSTPTGALDNLPDLSEIIRTDKQLFSTQTEERLITLIDTLSLAQRNNELNNVPTTEIMEFYNYEIDRNKNLMNNMQRQLENASSEKTELLQHISLQNAELERYRTLNFNLNMKTQNLEKQSKDLVAERENFKRNYTDLVKRSTDQMQRIQVCEKRLTVKVSELIALQNEHTNLQEQLKKKAEELTHLESTLKESALKTEKLKKSISAFESEIKDKIRILEERDVELTNLKKLLEAEKEAKKKADGFIAVLEQQIQEKNEEIRNYEQELSDTEELRKTIMSLMESKKSKRKESARK